MGALCCFMPTLTDKRFINDKYITPHIANHPQNDIRLVRAYVTPFFFTQLIVYSVHGPVSKTQGNVFNSLWPLVMYVYRQWTGSSLVQVMAWHLFGAKPLPDPMLTYHQLHPQEHASMKLESKYKSFPQENPFINVICRMAAIMFGAQCF